MKKIFGLLILCMTFVLTSCEQLENPQSLIGHWRVVGDHWTADFDDEGELTISSVKYDCFHPYYYEATADSLYIYAIANTESGWAPSGTPYVCPYFFRGNHNLVIDGFNYAYEEKIGPIITTDFVEKKRVVLRRTSSLR